MQAGDYHYEYNSENVRISAQNKETKWSYLVDPQATYSQILITETYEKNLLGQFSKLTGSTLYTYGLGLISESSEKSGYLVYHFDQLGSTKRITDKDGKTVYTMSYGSYGELFGIKDAQGNLVNFKDNPIAFLYNGQYGIVTDQNTLTYMRARYYNPEIKRFLNQDVLTGSIGNSQSLNRYSYVQGNPIRFTDPFGLCPDGSGTEGFFEGLANDLKSAFNSAMMSIGKAIYDHLPGQARQAVDFAVAKTVSFMQKHADEINFVRSTVSAYKTRMREVLAIPHMVLAVVGCIPAVGAIADLIDAQLCLMELDFVGAGFSVICAAASLCAPGADQALGGIKIAKSAVRIGDIASAGKALKNIGNGVQLGKDAGKIADIVKGADNIGDALDGARTASNVADGVKATGNTLDATKSVDNVADAVKQTPTFGGCFTADTRIKTKDGSKRIADIKVGDEVYSENPETGETGYQKVAQVFVVKTNTILTIKTQSETIETTKPHPFYVIGKGFVAAKDLQVGDHLKMANGEEAIIESLTLTHHDDPITVYNFEVENWHTYHVSGSEVLVHNVAKNPCGVGGDASDAIHGNSKLNTKAQHGYEIFDKETGDVVKTGISGQTLNKNGTSPRANSQVNAWNRNAGFDKFDSRIMQTDMPGRQSALDWEMNNAMKLKGEGNSMSRHKRPTPWEE